MPGEGGQLVSGGALATGIPVIHRMVSAPSESQERHIYERPGLMLKASCCVTQTRPSQPPYVYSLLAPSGQSCLAVICEGPGSAILNSNAAASHPQYRLSMDSEQ